MQVWHYGNSKHKSNKKAFYKRCDEFMVPQIVLILTLVFTWTTFILTTFPITRISHTCNKLLFWKVQYKFEQKHWTVIKLIRKFIKVLSIWIQIICKREWLERPSYYMSIYCVCLNIPYPVFITYAVFGHSCLLLGYVDGCPYWCFGLINLRGIVVTFWL